MINQVTNFENGTVRGVFMVDEGDQNYTRVKHYSDVLCSMVF